MTENVKEIKIAYIGGGSHYWAFELMSDLALCPHLKGNLALYDLNIAAAQRNAKIADAIFKKEDSKTYFTTTASTTIGEALKGADFVICSIEPGPMEMRYADLVIPQKYGILQSVGDTVGPGGFIRGLRSIPMKMDIAREIMKHCPDAWVINYTNPMTLCTQAFFTAEPDIKAFGCCHEVFGWKAKIGALAKEWFDLDYTPPRQEIWMDVSGVNHFTMTPAVQWNGIELMPRIKEMIARENFFADRTETALKRKEEKQWFTSDGLVGYEFLKRFDVLGIAGDRHLAEFVPWYLTSEENAHRYGFILTPYEYRINSRSGEPTVEHYRTRVLNPTGEEGVQQIMALAGIEPLDTNVNIPNMGQMPGVPLGAVVETMAQFRNNNLAPIQAQELPPAALSLQQRIIEVQQLTMLAAVTQDRDIAMQALLLDPLCGRLTVDEAWKMLNEMIDHTAQFLPGW